MEQEMNESTRVMPSGGVAPQDRTMVATAQPTIGAGATQMGQMVSCAVCGTNSPALETYCVECGFLLTSVPGSTPAESDTIPAGPEFALVESTSGRRYLLSEGDNMVGRENCDVLLMDGTVSRRHAKVTLSEGAVSVTDLGSTNGTQVNGTPVSPNTETAVSTNTAVRFGNVALTLAGPAGSPEATIVSAAPVQPATAVEVESPPEAVTEATLLSEPVVAAAAVPDFEIPAIEEPVTEAPAVFEPIAAHLRSTSPGWTDIAIKEGTSTVGRRAGNDVILDGDPYVSGRHADLICDSAGCGITDVGSTNGTTVNGTKLTPNERQPLVDGDEVGIGQGTYRFETAVAVSPNPPVASDEEAPIEGEAQA
jgi:pSer/pThr/pTyr-binding forkhead associated (FHA) protein